MAGATRSYNFKVVLLGEGCVGKTSCVLRYVEDKFNDRHITTLQVGKNCIMYQVSAVHVVLGFVTYKLYYNPGFVPQQEDKFERETNKPVNMGHSRTRKIPRPRSYLLQRIQW